MEDTESPNSGAPHEWPFELLDPAAFTVPKRDVREVFIDNTGWDSTAFTGVALVQEVNRWHRAEGWKGITYHFVVDKSGNIVKGRSVEEPAIISADKRNGRALVIAVQGLWHFTEIQMKSVDVLCHAIDSAYRIARRSVVFRGICEINDVPSPMFDYRALLALNSEGLYNKGEALVASLIAERATFIQPLGAVA